jgi:hypothetical protein
LENNRGEATFVPRAALMRGKPQPVINRDLEQYIILNPAKGVSKYMMNNRAKGQLSGLSQSFLRKNRPLFELDIKKWGRRTLLRAICCCGIIILLFSLKLIGTSAADRITEEVAFRLRQEITYKDILDRAMLFREAITNRGGQLLEVMNLEAGLTRRLILPMEGTISVLFNEKIPASGKVSRGILIEAEGIQNVLAADDGVVIEQAPSLNEGQSIIIKHRGDILTAYKNMSSSRVELNQRVSKGDVIGESKESIIFEVWDKKEPVDPLDFIDLDKSKL